MHFLALEAVDTLDFRVGWHVKLAYCRYKEIADDGVLWVGLGVFAAFRHRDMRAPFLCLTIPACILDGSVEADMLVKIVFLRYADEIGKNLLLAWILSGPDRV